MASRGAVRLLVEASSGGDEGAALVAAAIGPSAGTGDWVIEPFFEDDGELFLVVGSPPVPFTPAMVYELARHLAAADGIERVEPDLPVTAFAPGPDPEPALGAFAEAALTAADLSWALDAIRCGEAWALVPSRGAGIRIGHPDTGYSTHWVFGVDQEALDLDADRDFVGDDADALDPLAKGFPLTKFPGHGTGTGGVIVGRGDEQRGCRGVAPAATLVPIRAVNSVIQFFDSDVARSVEHARSVGCHVISMSLGGKGLFGLHKAIDRARRSGVIVMAAAGNHVRLVTSPASYDNCLAIAATRRDGKPWTGSSRGRKVTFSAPGSELIGAAWDLDGPVTPKVSPKHGTSFAVAHVAGVAALWLAHHGLDVLRARYPGHAMQEAFEAIVRQNGHAVPPDWDSSRYGVGIIDAARVIEAPLPTMPIGGLAAFGTDPPSGAARIASVFSDLDESDVVGRLGSAGDVDDLLASELLYQLMNDPEACRSFVDDDPAALGAFGGGWRQRILSGSSPHLAAALEGGSR